MTNVLYLFDRRAGDYAAACQRRIADDAKRAEQVLADIAAAQAEYDALLDRLAEQMDAR